MLEGGDIAVTSPFFVRVIDRVHDALCDATRHVIILVGTEVVARHEWWC